MKENYKHTVCKLEQNEIIAKIEEPMEYVNLLVLVNHPNGDI